jgi:IS30 family transposase
MGNYLKMADKQRIQALLEFGWSYRRIQRETGVDRETVARYDPRREPKAAKVSAGSVSKPARVSTGPASACEPYQGIIEAAVARGLTAQRIWQDLREDYTSATSMPRSNASSAPSSVATLRWPRSWSIRRVRRRR